ncbi:MAG: histone deacetylase [archaeon]
MQFIYNSVFLGHDSKDSRENSSRLKHFAHLKETRLASGEAYLPLAHSKEYIELVKRASGLGWGYLDSETYITSKSFETASYAVSASIKAAEENAFALVRPPGHHACRDKGMGFCLFNNMAIATKYLLGKGKRVFVVDIDLHHGNGTQEILEGLENAFYFSLHQFPLFPGTGRGIGKNYANVCLPPRVTDTAYIRQLENKLYPALKAFQPDIIGVSAGFDTYYKDLNILGSNTGFNLTKRSYSSLREILANWPAFYILEGGYNPESVKEGVEALTGVEVK